MARRFWAEQVGTKEAMMALHDLEGYDEVVQKFLELIPPEQRLAGLAPEQAVLALHDLEGYDEVVQKFLELIPPEQRLAGLAPEQAVLALPEEVLRALSDDFLENLPEPTRATIRRRLDR
jgi:hypothetical protein